MKFLQAALILATGVSMMSAQDVISAKSGLIHYFEGVVTLDGKEIEKKNASEFSSMREGSELRTGLGRAEVLLSPGVFLRVSENSGVRLVSNSLVDTKLALTAGSVLLEVGETEKGQALSMMVGDSKIDLSHRGLFRIDFDPAELKVHDGSAVVTANGQTVTVKEGKVLPLTGVLAATKFNKDDGDAFFRWASRRSGYIATANLTAAKRVYDTGNYYGSSSWIFNPYLGMFTFMPLRGIYRSPFGYSYFSPYTIGDVYYRPVYTAPVNSGWSRPAITDAGRGMADMGGGRGGYSSGGAAMSAPAPAMSSAPAAPAASGRDAGHSSGGRGR